MKHLLLSRSAILLLALNFTLINSASAACNDMEDGPQVTCMLDQVGDLVAANNLPEATQVAFDAMELARELGEVGPLYYAHLVTGRLYAAKMDHTNAMRQFVQALKVANEHSNTAWTVEAKGEIGSTFTQLEDYAQAEHNLMEALVLAQNDKMWEKAAVIHANLGDVFLRKGVIGKSQQNLKSAIELFIEQERIPEAGNVSGKLADQFLESGDYDNAEHFAEQTLQLHSRSENFPAIALDNQRLAKVYAAFEDYESAIRYTERAHGIYKRLGSNIGIVKSLRDYAVYYQLQGDKKNAIANADAAMAGLRVIEGSLGFEVAQDLSKVYDQAGNLGLALTAQRDYVRRREAFFSGEKSRALVELTTRYESEFATEQQQRRIEMLEVDEASSRNSRLFLLIVLAMIGALAVSLMLSNRRKKRDNATLTSKNEEIGRQKTEIDLKNLELGEKNDSLNGLNAKLVDEMAERESIQKTSFARDRFLATMSHEMRTPINIISGLCHLLLEENPRPDQREHLRTLQFSANNLVVFINDILDFSKIEAGKLNLEKRVFSPKQLFEEVSNRFAQAAKEKDIKVNYNYDDSIPDCLLGDPARLNQIMTNLVSTSFAHSVASEVDITMHADQYSAEETTVRFEINDKGQAIDEKQLESMFRSFTYNPDDVFEGYNSSDLVLAITRRLVDLQNGHVEVKPLAGGGNRYVVILKFKIPSKAAQIKRVGAAKTFEHLAGNTVLLVEDNKINQLVVQKMLSRLGIEVTTADNGLEALEVLNNGTFDICLMDIQMPKMDGYRATAEIRKHVNPSVREMPVIALTASAFLSEREKAKLFGMNDHVGKPFAPEELLDKMTTSLAIFRGEIVDVDELTEVTKAESNV